MELLKFHSRGEDLMTRMFNQFQGEAGSLARSEPQVIL